MKKGYLLFLLALTIFTLSCQQSEIIEETFVEEQTVIENDALEDRGYEETWKQYGSVTRWKFFVQNNIWNVNTQGASSQKVWVNSMNNWGVNANHSVGSGEIKSYPAIVIGKHYGHSASNTMGLPKKVSELGNMWCEWQQWNTITKGNTSFDIWFHSTKDHGYTEADIELMIWTQHKGNQNPIAHAYDANGAIPIAKKWFNGKEYKIYSGVNGNGTKVYTFIQTDNSGQFRGRIKHFVDYCKSQGWVNDNHYLLSVQAGWEMISGGKATTNKFAIFL